jgi:Ser/Thr protein kinase RdoA (MazF antagonist)
VSLRRRDPLRFRAEELAIVLSHYDLGVIESITEFRRGSRRSPKVGIVAERGKFLLKKRDRTRGGADRVRYSHAIQEHLREKGFPLPALISPRGQDDSVGTMVRYHGALYELFDYVAGHPFCGEGQETRDAGRMLASFHQAMADFPVNGGLFSTGYHDATAVQTGLNAIPGQVSLHDSAAGQDAEILSLTTFLFDAYIEASAAVDGAGYAGWPDCITHSDWHPGNILFKRGRVLAVVDYDCAKVGKTASDVANGALQFSMIGGTDPATWPDHLDLNRFRQFVAGYEEVTAIAPEQYQALPYLMIEALIAESVLPIAATGSFGPFPGFGFMRMVRRKVAWIRENLTSMDAIA